MVLSDGSLSINQNIQIVGNYTETLKGKERQKVQVDPQETCGFIYLRFWVKHG